MGFEFKRTVAPALSRSMYSALEDLKLTHLYVVHAGNTTYPLAGKVTALSLKIVLEYLLPLKFRE